MSTELSENTKAILLLTAPLITGRSQKQTALLKPSEYKRFALYLRSADLQPADLVSTNAGDVLRKCADHVDETRLKILLNRGFQLSQAVEHWKSRAIWVLSRADAEYPRRFKKRLREDAPAVLYGCGQKSILESGGLAVVGSRHVDQNLVDFTKRVGSDVARASCTLVSGGAKGIDLAAMQGASDAGGMVCGVLSGSLKKQAMSRDNRDALLDGRLVFVSHCDPAAGFNVGNAMQRNKYIYALSDAALVVNSDLKGGTWEGATEQLTRFHFVPVHVRATGAPSPGLDALRKQGALDWPELSNSSELRSLLERKAQISSEAPQLGLALRECVSESNVDDAVDTSSKRIVTTQKVLTQDDSETSRIDSSTGNLNLRTSQMLTNKKRSSVRTNGTESTLHVEKIGEGRTPAELLYSTVSEAMREVLSRPMKDDEVASALGVTKSQATAWLKRLVTEGEVERKSKPVRYVAKR